MARTVVLRRALPRPLGVVASILGVVVSVAAAGVLLMPAESIQSLLATRATLDPSRLRPNGGHAWVLDLDLQAPSDREAASSLELTEDGVPLSPHAAHQRIRDEGGGRFSHWGGSLYLSASDNSDPRTNGRTYALVVPLSAAALSRGAQAGWVALVGGAALALIASALVRGGRAVWLLRGTALASAVLAAAVLHSTRGGIHLVHRVDNVAEALESGTTASAPPAAHALDPPRTMRLLTDAVTFEAAGELPRPAPPIRVTLVPGPGVDEQDGLLRLEQGETLVSEGPIAVSAGHLAELVVRARIRSGTALRLTFDTDPPLESLSAAQLVVPVSPSDDWQTLRVARPLNRDQVARWLVTGDRQLARIELGPLAGATEPLALELEPLVLLDDQGLYSHAAEGTDWIETDHSFRPARWQSAAGTFTLPWPAGARGRLRGAVSAVAGAQDASPPWRVQVEDAAGRRTTVVEGHASRSDGWQSLDLELPDDARPERVLLSAPDLPAGTTLAWTDWRVVDTSRPPQRALLFLVDTLRGDALGCLGHPTNRTPVLDDLAASGALFTRCFSQAFWTRPSVPSLMAGRYVHATGVHSAGLYLPDSYETLAEGFAAAGFQAVGFVSNAHAGPAAGLLQGLDEMVLRTDVDDTARFLDEVVAPRLESLLDEDLFAWIHLMEVHGPYGPHDAPEGWQPPAGGTPVEWDERYDRSWNAAPTAESRVALYDGDLESLDGSLGAFLDAWLPRFAANGPAPVIAVAADHGEFLGEYGKWGHEWDRLLPETVHVPLILWAPGRLEAGTVWDRPVENIDVGPTLLDLAGARRWDPAWERPDRGRSLLAVIAGQAGGEDAALAAYDRGNGSPGTLSLFLPEEGLVGDEGTLIGTVGPDLGGFRPLAAPARLSEVGPDLSAPFAHLWDVYLQTQDDVRRSLWGSQAASSSQQIDAASIEQMQALGYLGR